ncbi:hypothetical protein N7541_004911 [Penicillium brevicompactum]|uniref:Uncharacterized protein n=1 Tax=Penicillium brevicompactum TaxID=5074 RepID=A0A9W9RCM4_PENBR|nr:hypothetical protein N7541_004911 [Penicillium brevicompactum]
MSVALVSSICTLNQCVDPKIPRNHTSGSPNEAWSKGTLDSDCAPTVGSLQSYSMEPFSPLVPSPVPVPTLTDEIPRSMPKFFAFPGAPFMLHLT